MLQGVITAYCLLLTAYCLLLTAYLYVPRPHTIRAENVHMTTDGIPCGFLAVYGTLRRRSIYHKLPIVVAGLQYIGYGLIRGRLLWQRTYPALIQERGVAQVELFQILDPNVLCDLDFYEGFDPSNLRASLFVRRQILLLNPQVWAYAYFLNLQIPRGPQ